MLLLTAVLPVFFSEVLYDRDVTSLPYNFWQLTVFLMMIISVCSVVVFRNLIDTDISLR